MPLLIMLRSMSAALELASIDDGELRFDEYTMIMSHNSAANKDAAGGDFFKLFGIDQENSIYDQVRTSGVRGLSLDIKLDTSDRSKLRLVHHPIDYSDFETEMQSHLVTFLEEDEDAIVAINFEVIDSGEETQRPTILANLQNTFSNLSVNGVPLSDMTFKYNSELWKDHADWPTLKEMRTSGQRLFVFHDRSELRSTEYGFIFREDAMKENFWEGLDDCRARYQWDSDKVSFPNSDLSWSRLFFMNHFDSILSTVGENLLGGGTNGWGKLYPRVKKCMENNGSIKPNFISLDWVIQGEEALEVAQYLNFGGRIGSGQLCLDDSDCATETCNRMLSLCQCQVCETFPIGHDSCIGCEDGEFCAPASENRLNECSRITEEVVSIAPTDLPTEEPSVASTTNPPSSLPSSIPTISTISPTTNAPTTRPTDVPVSPTDMPVETTEAPTTSSPTSSPSRASFPTSMPIEPTVSPTSTPSYSPSATPVKITGTPIISSHSPTTTEPTAAEDIISTPTPTAPISESTAMPVGIQSQEASIANAKESDSFANSAPVLIHALLETKVLLVFGVLFQLLSL